MVEPELNPAQQEVIAQLRADEAERPIFDPALRAELRARLAETLDHLAAQLPPDQDLWLSKHLLSRVHGCETRFLAEREEPFAWSIPAARGVIAHKAIELSIHWRRERIPLVLIDEALARLEQGSDNFAEWLQGISEAERAELRGEANDRIAKFLECWPRLRSGWRPVTESRLRADFADGRIVLNGKVDLTIGVADGLTANKVLIDLKTGGFTPSHLDDLRFYSLVETLRLGTPPRLVAGYYLDQGRFVIEPVTVRTLETTVERVLAGVEKIVALLAGSHSPDLKTGPACRWCVRREHCDAGKRFLGEHDELADVEYD